jgi:putative flippase GtrA
MQGGHEQEATLAAVTRSWGQHLARFLVVGACTVATDFVIYQVLLHLDVATVPAKSASFIAATILAYVLNRRWTFGAEGDRRTMVAFAALYACTLVANVTVNSLVLRLLDGVPGRVEIAFLVAQSVSTTINFVVMRQLIFTRRSRRPDLSPSATDASR